MSTYIRVLTPEGLQPVHYTAETLHDAAAYEPGDGVYTVTNTYHTFQVLKFDAHLDRMEDSARRENIALKLDRPTLKKALRTMIADAGFGDVRFRVTVSGSQPDHFIISLEPFKPPSPVMIAQGVTCVTVPNSARENAASKTTGWMHSRVALKEDENIYEVLLMDRDGYLMEGSSSNFYAILGGELYTADEGVLPGIARQIIYEVAPNILKLNKTPVHRMDLPKVEEAFITSSSRGIIPVVKIDDETIGEGVPGGLTLALRAAYTRWLEKNLTDL